MPNAFAYIVLYSWPLVTALLFRRCTPVQAVIWTILGGYLVLPPGAQMDLPILPDLNKFALPNICAFIGFLVTWRQPWQWPASRLVRIALAASLITPFGTVFTNPDFIPFAIGGLPAMGLTEIPSIILTNVVIALPLLIGVQLFRDDEAMRELLKALMVAGLCYSIPMLIEIRLSPQINVWVYGFFQHAFDQMMRYGGYRPIVFLPHGLWVAFFAFSAALAAVGLFFAEQKHRARQLFICIYLIVVTILCKSANAFVYLALFLPLLAFVSARIQVRLAAVLAAIVLCYPALRGSGFIPTSAIADFFASVDETRGRSLVFRLMNEDVLLEHASQRPWFGWGGWGRSLVYDHATGQLASTIDGQWIITIGMAGWVGYIGEFGLLTLPLILFALAARKKTVAISKYAATVALILAANLVDLVPNATLIPFTWLMAGAVLGYVEALVSTRVRETSSGRVAERSPWAREHPAV